jgi:hypothetical protein
LRVSRQGCQRVTGDIDLRYDHNVACGSVGQDLTDIRLGVKTNVGKGGNSYTLSMLCR